MDRVQFMKKVYFEGTGRDQYNYHAKSLDEINLENDKEVLEEWK